MANDDVCADAQTITWSGRSWKVTSGHMAGVAPGDPANITIDAQRYLHLRIVQQNGKWTLSVKLPGAPEHKFADLPLGSPDFHTLTWIGFSSMATEHTVFYQATMNR